MPLFSLSPSVEVKEEDLTLIVPAVATSIGGFAGVSSWGPVNSPTTIDSENTLIRLFGEPDDFTKRDIMTAATYLSYTNHLKFVRVVGDDATNAFSGGSVAPRLFNLVQYESAITAASYSDIKFAAKYPGARGNSIRVSIADSESYGSWEYRQLFGSEISVSKVGSITDTSATVTFTGSVTTTSLSVGMSVVGTGIPAGAKILTINSATSITLTADATATSASANLTFTRYTGAPDTSAYVANKNGSNDELHIVVIDVDGLWSGVKGYVLERHVGLSKAADAKDYSGASSYYVNVLNRTSNYVWFGAEHEGANWGNTASGTTFDSLPVAVNFDFAGGVDDNENITLNNRLEGYEFFFNDAEIDVNLLFAAGLEDSDEQLVLNNLLTEIAETRKDCIALLSPPMNAVVNNIGNELQSLVAFRGLHNSSSYSVMNSGWKYVYNVYMDEYNWIPLSADIAGLCARTDHVTEPWFSPAGLNRGFIRNAVKLAYNPGSKAERDTLYVEGINPVCIIPGEGIVLFGDKTMQAKPSAFDRINVRRLFIVLEKAIATAAKYQLFEFNDAYTRAQFIGAVEPYLRSVQGRRGITGFKVICDTTNNTPEIIDSNGFVANIRIAPARSINFIELTFTAVGTGVSFDERVSG